jgi:hypothetical protein
MTKFNSPWENVYWFARMLINIDKYGAVGKHTSFLVRLSSDLRISLKINDCDEKSNVNICKSIINESLEKRFKKAKALADRITLFRADLSDKIKTESDLIVLILTIESIMIPINNSIESIPNDDKEYTEETAKAYLDELGEKGLATVINIWDDLGTSGCLNAERTVVVREFHRLRKDISQMSEQENNLILTAFIQEFERRLGQKRKGRAGTSLEDVTSFIFNYYGIKNSDAPDHFQADIEVDKWIKCSDGWLIGISCKRTLRERWKQVSSADRKVLSRFKIKELWHVVTYDEDLSDDKIVTLGEQGHVFYLKNESRIFSNASAHIGMKNYVRPMTEFIRDLKQVT